MSVPNPVVARSPDRATGPDRRSPASRLDLAAHLLTVPQQVVKRRRGDLRIRGIDLDENLLMVEGAIPGPREGYVMISKSKAPPRERRGFGGGGTVDPLKASKKASGAKPSGGKKK